MMLPGDNADNEDSRRWNPGPDVPCRCSQGWFYVGLKGTARTKAYVSTEWGTGWGSLYLRYCLVTIQREVQNPPASPG